MRFATRLASRRLDGGSLTVFVFHKVLQEPSAFYPDIPDRNEFAKILDWISEQFNVVRLADAVERLEAGNLPERAAAITFDDGNGDTLACSAPIFEQKGIPATFFINTAYLDGGEPFFERIFKALETTTASSADFRAVGAGLVSLATPKARREIADMLCEKAKYLSPSDADEFSRIIVTELGSNSAVQMVRAQDVIQRKCTWVDFGGHSHHHSILTTLHKDAAESEINRCRQTLTELTGNPAPLFAYPNGKPGRDFTTEHEAMVRKAGFMAAFSCATGVMKRESNLFNAPRFTAWDKTRLKFQARMLMNLING